MAYGWMITHDYTEFDKSDVGTIGSSGTKFSKSSQILKGKAFKMKDGDGNIVYRGRMIGNYNFDGFEPLDDFGTPNAGCTEIWYYENGKWVEN